MPARSPAAAQPNFPDDGAANLLLLPLKSLEALSAFNVELCHLWGRMALGWMFPPHAHEGCFQLEIPDPLADALEQDLFA